MRAELAEHPGLFAPVAEHPATEAALVATYRELRDLSPAALDRLAATSGRAGEVVRLHRGVRARLAPAWSDEEDLLEAATAAVEAGRTSELGSVVVHLPQRVSQHAARLLTAVAEAVPTTVVVSLTGVAEADAEVRASLARMGLTVDPEPGRPPLPMEPGSTSILTASDADEEVRAAVRAVLDAVRAGTRLDRIAVLHASPDPYARLTHEQLHSAGIATNGAAVVPLSARIAGRTLLELLRLPDGRFRRQDVFAWLASAPILAEGRWAPTTAWERVSRSAAVIAGRDDWDRLLENAALGFDRQAALEEKDDEKADWAPERSRANAARARELRTFVLRIIDDLARASARPRPWSEQAAWAHRWLLRLLGPATRRERWPEAERKAAERVEQAIDRLGALDAVEGPVLLPVFTRTLELELENDLGRVGRLGDGVLVGSVEMGIGLDLDLVVILGLAEGSFPATVRDDSLLPDRERAVTGGELGLRADRVARQHRQLLGSLAGASARLLCVPRGDLRRSVDRVPSRWVLDIAATLAGDGRRWWAPDLRAAQAEWVREVASFDAGLRALAVPATEQEHRLRGLLATGGDLSTTTDGCTALAAEVLTARRSPRFTRFDGNLEGLPVPSPVDRVTSPTRLERWAACPHRHLVEDLLGAAPVENPEEAFVITPIHRGNLIHKALERFIREVLDRPEVDRPAPGMPWTAADVERITEIGEELCDEYEALGITGRPIFWRRDRRRILLDLHQFLVRDSIHRIETRSAPFAAELSFGFGDGLPAVQVPLPDGRSLAVRGWIDRVDLRSDGTVHVTDYKTGSMWGYGGVHDGDPVAHGTRLQLPLYGLAGRAAVGDPARPVRADYWFVTSRQDFAREGFDITDEVIERTKEVLQAIVGGIETGLFPPHPDELSTFFRIGCHVCNPDGLGTAELRKQWERKRHDPFLARYAELAEPLEVEG
jgi:RecB family exonuclease